MRVDLEDVMGYLKHESKGKGRQAPKPKKQESPEPSTVALTGPESRSMQHEVNYVQGIDGVEVALDGIANGIGRLTNEDFPVHLILAQGSNTNPVQITLKSNDYDDTMDRLVTALERIADSIARLAGLSRPR